MNSAQNREIATTLAATVVLITVFGLLYMFVWNYGVAYLAPVKPIGFLSSLAIAIGGYGSHLLLRFYMLTYAQMKSEKAIREALVKQIEEDSSVRGEALMQIMNRRQN
jgi:hypothetical protein